ncbi:MAG TPA: T9SS type A sorting domain-containing protein, partial [Bacteroidia bacterium]|nr:T9SS type A sorting domain-containing protein [Bacteroidia bacterium]
MGITPPPLSGPGYTIYPNPFSEQINIQVPGEYAGKEITLKLYDITGRIVLEKNNDGPHNTEIQLDTEMLPKGIYILTVQSGINRQNFKLVK